MNLVLTYGLSLTKKAQNRKDKTNE